MKETWLRALEQANRSLGGELPIDVFLPELHAITDPEPAPPVEASEPPPAPAPRRRSGRPGPGVPTAVRAAPTAPPPAAAAPSQAEVDAEIREFMNRNERGPSEDDDFSQFMGGMDPNLDPE